MIKKSQVDKSLVMMVEQHEWSPLTMTNLRREKKKQSSHAQSETGRVVRRCKSQHTDL